MTQKCKHVWNEKKKKKAKKINQKHAFKGFAKSCNVEIINSFILEL